MGVIKINGVTYGGDNSVMLTQAEYDALVAAGTVDPTVLYMITDRNLGSTPYASGIIYDNSDSGLDATNVQNAIDEVAETAVGVVLTQDEYQDLVDAGEVNPDINYYISDANSSTPLYASGVHYDNSNSGLSATDVQEAVDEVAWTVTDTVLTDDASIGTYISDSASKQIIKCNKFYLLNLDTTMKARSASSGWATCWTLPSGITPPSADIIVATVSVNNKVQRVRITTLGEVQINLYFPADNSERICIQIMYIV